MRLVINTAGPVHGRSESPTDRQTAVIAWRRLQMPKQIVGIRLPLALLVVLGVIGGDFLVRQVLDTQNSDEPAEAETPTGWWTLTPEEQAIPSGRIFPERAFEDSLANAPGIANVPRLLAADPEASDIQYFPTPFASVEERPTTNDPLDPLPGRAIVGASNTDEQQAPTPNGRTNPTPPIDTPDASGQTDTAAVPGHVTNEADTAQRPQELPRTPHAAPIPDKPNVPSTRALIGRELPHLSPEEQQIWQETLQGLSPDMIRELLQFRRQAPISGADSPPTPDLPIPGTQRPANQRPGLPLPSFPQSPLPLSSLPQSPLPLSPLPLPHTQDSVPLPETTRPPNLAFLSPMSHPEHADYLVLLRQATNVLASNILNAETPGFKAVDVTLLAALEPTAATGVHPHRLHLAINMAQGALQRTDRPLDVAIVGNGFFNVINEIQSHWYYARYGRLSLDQDGTLCLRYGKQNLRLEPTIKVPLDTVRIEILSDGLVQAWQAHFQEPTQLGTLQLTTFQNPAGLQRRGALFQETPRSGPAQVCSPDQEGAGRIHQGFLERSNVQIENQLRTMKRFQKMAAVLQHFDSREPAAVGPWIDPSRLTIHDLNGTPRR